MTLYRQSVCDFSAVEHHFADLISEQMQIRTGRRPSDSERRSWQRSIPALRADLISAGLNDVEMLFEFQLPLTSKRADVVLLRGELHDLDKLRDRIAGVWKDGLRVI